MTLTDVTNSNMKNRKQLDDYTCGLVIGRHMANQNPTTIAREMGIPKSTVTDCINRYIKTGTGVIQKRTGRPPKLSERDERAMVRNFREQPFVSFVEHAANLKDAGINIHPQTLSIYARRNGFGSYTPASVPLLRSTHIEKRLAWAREKVNWSPEQWIDVIWSDESKFNLNGSDGRMRVIRKEGERFSPNHVRKTVKFGNGSVMIWGCFWAGGLGPIVTMKGSVDQDAYVNCLANHFLPWLQNLSLEHSRDFIFQEDGASCHTGQYATWYGNRSYLLS